MTGRSACLIFLTMIVACAGGAHADTLGGPALAAEMLAFDSDRTGNFEVYVMQTDGSQVRRLTSNPDYDSWWARIAPDRRRILFYRTPKGVHDTDYGRTSLWMMSADGTGQTLLLDTGAYGWGMHGHAEWSPDGRSLVMFAGNRINPQLFITDTAGRSPRRITNRGGQNLDPSWSPDGATIVFVGCPAAICFERNYEIYTIPAAGGQATRLTKNTVRDHDPYYSPDGARIAWLAQTDRSAFGGIGAWDVLVMGADGSHPRNLTRDGQINSKPQWALDGTRIYFHRLAPAVSPLWNLYHMRPDGSGITQLTNGPGNAEYPSN